MIRVACQTQILHRLCIQENRNECLKKIAQIKVNARINVNPMKALSVNGNKYKSENENEIRSRTRALHPKQ